MTTAYYEATNKSDMDLIWKMGLADCKANQNVKFIFEFETSGTPGSLINYVLDQINSSDKKNVCLKHIQKLNMCLVQVQAKIR